MSVCLSAWNSAPNGRIFMKFDIRLFFENLSRKSKCFIISYSVHLGMRNASHKSCRENQNLNITLSNIFFEGRAVYETMWKYAVNPGRPQMTIRRMRMYAG